MSNNFMMLYLYECWYCLIAFWFCRQKALQKTTWRQEASDSQATYWWVEHAYEDGEKTFVNVFSSLCSKMLTNMYVFFFAKVKRSKNDWYTLIAAGRPLYNKIAKL